MHNSAIIYIFNRLVRLAIIFFILYLIFTNFGTFLLIVGTIILIISFLIYNFKKKIKTKGFEFKFNNSSFNNQNFNFNDFANQPKYDEIGKAKDFFQFSHTPTKEEVKKRYKQLARLYHPDMPEGSEEKMKDLNYYRDILMKVAT